MPAPVATRTVGDLLTYVKRQFGDESGVQITDADIIRWCNQGAMAIVSKNPIKQAYADTNTIVGTREYSMPADLISMIAVEYDDKYMLTATSMEGLKELVASHQSTTGVSEYWYMFANKIFLWPVPSAVVNLRIYYVQAPAGVTVAADLIPVPDRYYELLCKFCMQKAYELDEDLTQAQAQGAGFESGLVSLSNAENVQQGGFHVVAEDWEGGYFSRTYWVDGYYT